MAIVFADKRWSHLWSNRHIIIHSDSTSAVSIVNKGTTKNSTLMSFLRELFWLSALYNFRITAVYIPGHMNYIADATSRLHQASYLLKIFYLFHLLFNMSVYSCSFLLFRYFGFYFPKDLQDEVFYYRSHTFSENTKRTYESHIDSYVTFCLLMNIPAVPAITFNIGLMLHFLPDL